MTPSDLVALVARLRNFNPPDRTVDELRPTSQAIYDAAAAIEQLQAELADCHRVITIWDASDLKARPAVEQYARAERAETERDALRAELEACRKQLQIKERAARTAFDHIFGVASEYWDGNYERDAARAQGEK